MYIILFDIVSSYISREIHIKSYLLFNLRKIYISSTFALSSVKIFNFKNPKKN